jgi:NAD(P)-dependent dehydrogenase (short-subunit alcohol dehydrogenase family)
MGTRVAAVTGAAGGMGRAIVARLIEDGLHVAGLDLDASGLDAMAEQHGERFLPCPADLTRVEQVTQSFERIDARWGGLDALVNNAGTASCPTSPTSRPRSSTGRCR